jgi:hypothetical protein
LLRQQFVELHAPPGREIARFQRALRDFGRRRVQEANRRAELGQAQPLQQIGRQGIAEIEARQRLGYQAPQRRLAEAGGGRINRRQPLGQAIAGHHRMKAWMDDFGPEKAVVDLAEHAQTGAGLQDFLLVGVEVKEAQRNGTTGITHPRNQLAARSVGELAVGDFDLELCGDARHSIGQRGDAGFVLVAQRQVEDKIGVGPEAQPGQPRRQRVAGGRCFSQGPGRRRPRPGRRAAVP